VPRKRRGTNTGVSGLSFSWRQATGVTRAKRNFAPKTGIPTTRSGRGRMYAIGCGLCWRVRGIRYDNLKRCVEG